MDIHFAGLVEIARRIRRREIASEEVVRILLVRIDRLDRKLHSFITVMADSALVDARQADREIALGLDRGPLHGVPIGLKDLLFVKDVANSSGTDFMRNWRPSYDATVVSKLRRAGAVLMGKLNMTEGAGFEHHPAYFKPVNPWNDAAWTGASSSGAGVATAAGLCYGAIGSDTGGSIRLPSARCGLSGIKPTWGRVSRFGVFPVAETLDHVGPMARSAEDAAAMLQAIAGADPKDPTTLAAPVPDYLGTLRKGVSGLVVGIDRAFNSEDVAPEVIEGVERAARVLADAGAIVREVEMPPTRTLMADVGAAMMSEMAAAREASFTGQAHRYGPWLRGALEGAFQLRGVDVAKANIARLAFAQLMRSLFGSIDLLIVPTMSTASLLWDDIEAMGGDMVLLGRILMRFTFLFNVSGNPTITLPSGFNPDGTPLSLQIVGAHLREDLLCRAGYTFQQVTDHHLRRPLLD